MSKTGELTATVPESWEVQAARFRKWFEGETDDHGNQQPGLLLMVGELYREFQLRKERREALNRALTSGSILAIFGIAAAWLKDHLR